MLVLDESDPYTAVFYIPKTSVDGVPPGAVIGGHTADGFPLYVVWSFLTSSLDVRSGVAEYVSHQDVAVTRTEWDYMIVDYSEWLCNKTYPSKIRIKLKSCEISFSHNIRFRRSIVEICPVHDNIVLSVKF